MRTTIFFSLAVALVLGLFLSPIETSTVGLAVAPIRDPGVQQDPRINGGTGGQINALPTTGGLNTGVVAEPDQDLDQVPDPVDNCPGDPNPGQEDTDGDGFGDVCDNCPNDANPLQEDANTNGIGDVCEVVQNVGGPAPTFNPTPVQQPVQPTAPQTGIIEPEPAPTNEPIGIQPVQVNGTFLEPVAPEPGVLEPVLGQEPLPTFVGLENETNNTPIIPQNFLPGGVTEPNGTNVAPTISEPGIPVAPFVEPGVGPVTPGVPLENGTIPIPGTPVPFERTGGGVPLERNVGEVFLPLEEPLEEELFVPVVAQPIREEQMISVIDRIHAGHVREIEREGVGGVEGEIADPAVDEGEVTDRDRERVVPTKEKLREKVEKTKEHLNIERAVQNYVPPDEVLTTEEERFLKEEEQLTFTQVVVSLTPETTMYDVEIYEEIPKDVANHVDQLIFHEENYRVIEADPLIAWSFPVLDEGVTKKITYSVKKEVPLEEIEEIATVPVAEKIGSSILGFVLIPLVAFVIIFFSHFVGHQRRESGRVKRLSGLVGQLKKEGHSKEDIETTLIRMGYTSQEVEKLLKK